MQSARLSWRRPEYPQPSRRPHHFIEVSNMKTEEVVGGWSITNRPLKSLIIRKEPGQSECARRQWSRVQGGSYFGRQVLGMGPAHSIQSDRHQRIKAKLIRLSSHLKVKRWRSFPTFNPKLIIILMWVIFCLICKVDKTEVRKPVTRTRLVRCKKKKKKTLTQIVTAETQENRVLIK